MCNLFDVAAAVVNSNVCEMDDMGVCCFAGQGVRWLQGGHEGLSPDGRWWLHWCCGDATAVLARVVAAAGVVHQAPAVQVELPHQVNTRPRPR